MARNVMGEGRKEEGRLRPRVSSETMGTAFPSTRFETSSLLWLNVDRISRKVDPGTHYKRLHLLEACLLMWFNCSPDQEEEEKRQHLISFYGSLLRRCDLFSGHSNYKNSLNNQWLLFQQMTKLGLPFDVLAMNELGLKLTLVHEDQEETCKTLFPLIETRDYFSDKFVIRVKDLIMAKPRVGQVIVEQLNQMIDHYMKSSRSAVRFSNYNFLITDCLCYALKKQLAFNLILDLLNILPEDQVNDERLVPLLRDFAGKVNETLEDPDETRRKNMLSRYHASIIGKETTDLSLLLAKKRWEQEKERRRGQLLVDPTTGGFRATNCFLLALKEKKHFLEELLSYDVSNLDYIPVRLQLFYLLDKLNAFTSSSISNTDVAHYLQIADRLRTHVHRNQEEAFSDAVLTTLNKQLKWIFQFTDWCLKKITPNPSPVNNGNNLRVNIFHSLLACDSPLNVLHKFGILSALSIELEDDEEVVEELYDLLSDCRNNNEVAIWWAFLAIKLTMSWIISEDPIAEGLQQEEDEEFLDLPSQIESIVKKIKPLTFRTEILENLFSLLFVTQEDLVENNDNDSDEGGLNEDSLTGTKTEDSGTEVRSRRTATMSSATATSSNLVVSSSETFICPNEVVPKYLAMLKEATFDTQAALRSQTMKSMDEETNTKVESVEEVSVVSSVRDLEDCKDRLKDLMHYINEAQWRYSVIEPAFIEKRVPKAPKRSREETNFSESSSYYDSEETGTEADDKHRDYRGILWMDSETGSSVAEPSRDRNRGRMFSSVIPCMLATSEQLLRYCLIEGHFERAKQVYKLFESSLKDKEEAQELNIIDKWREMAVKLKTVSSPFKKPSSRIAVAAARGLKTSQVHSIIHEFLTEINPEASGRTYANLVLTDFAVTSAPTIELTELMLETSLRNGEVVKGKEAISEKIDTFLKRLTSLLSVTHELEIVKTTALSSLLAYNCNQYLFSNPRSLVEENGREKKVKACIEDIKLLIAQDEPEDLTISLSTPVSHPHDSKKLTIEFQKLLRLCPPPKYNYLKALFYHVRRVSKVLAECKQRRMTVKETASAHGKSSSVLGMTSSGSYFSVLYQSPSAILCQMVLKDNIPPNYVDDLAKEMRVDLIGTLCSVLCPHIPAICRTEDLGVEFCLIDSCYPALCDLIESYLTGSMRKNESIMILDHFGLELGEKDKELRSKIDKIELINYFRSKSGLLVQILILLKLIDDRNTRKRSMSTDVALRPKSALTKWFDLVRKQFGNGSNSESALMALALHPKITICNSVVMKSLEGYATNKKLLKIYEAFQYLFLKNPSSSLLALKTAVMSKLTIEYEEIKFLLQIEDPSTKVDLLLNLIEEASIFNESQSAVRAISALMASIEKSSLAEETLTRLKQKLNAKAKQINCYAKISELSGLGESWKDALESLTEADILTILKTKKQFSLAIEWNDIVEVSPEKDPEVEELRNELLILAFCEKGEKALLEKLVLSVENLSPLVEKVLPQTENWELKEALISFLLENESQPVRREYYSHYLLGNKLIRLLPINARSHYAPLASKPLLIIEQLLMNVEYDALEKAIRSQKLIKCDLLVEMYAKKALYIQFCDGDVSSLLGSDTTCISSTAANECFLMPVLVPTKEQWIPDYKVSHCMSCRIEKFSTLFNRRHHCRRCGRVVCKGCSEKILVIHEISPFTGVRVCDDCYLQTTVASMTDRKESISSISLSVQTVHWLLSLNETQNGLTREEFYYESAPSSSLCLSILKLHTDKSTCIRLIVSQLVKTLLDNLASNQVDYGLLINIIRSLLLSAKVLLGDETKDGHSLNYIDLMLGRIDIVKMLVNENCVQRDLINCVLFNENSMVKLQEKLLEMERFELALNIGMKFGLDTKAIWKTWAIICLKHGWFPEARIRFKRVLVEGEKSANSKHLQDIFAVFERLKVVGSRQGPRAHSLRDRVKAIKSGQITSLTPKDTAIASYIDTTSLPKYLMEEATYYLSLYGSREEYVKYYVRFSLWKEGVQLFLSEANPSALVNTFISDFLMPSLSVGAFTKILAIIKSMDPTFVKSWKYLFSACYHFSNNGFFNVLHSLQVFMGDYVRAAMTQINCFYLRKPILDYSELFARIDHLHIAKQHCNDYLINREHLHSGCFELAPESVEKQKRILNIQMEITTNFYQKGVKGFLPFSDELQVDRRESTEEMAFNSSFETGTNSPLTLLDKSKGRKIQLAALVAAEFGSTIGEGFTLTLQIIKDHRLDAALVYRFIGRTIVATKRGKAIEMLVQLLNCIRGSSRTEEGASLCDDVVGACIRSCNHQDLVEPLIKLLTSDVNKIDAYILSGRLKSAYLLGVRLERVVDIKRILAVAEHNQQESIKKICEMWLQKHDLN